MSYSFNTHVFSDISDRLSTIITSLFLIVAAVVVFLKQNVDFLGSNVTCWTPAYYRDQWTAYTNRNCYRAKAYAEYPLLPRNNYWELRQLLIPENFSDNNVVDQQIHIRKDHFVVLMLIFHALQFYFIRLIWATLSSKCGTDFSSILKVSSEVTGIFEPTARESQTKLLSQFIHHSISKCGILLGVLYLVAKFLFILNIFMQIYALQQFLGVETLWIVNYMKNGVESFPSFPRTFLCEYEVRVLGNLHRHTVQCSLDISYFLTNVYLIIWYWMVFVAIMSIFSFIYWFIITITCFIPPTRNLWIRKFLRTDIKETLTSYELNRFGSQLKSDGLIILHLVTSYTDEVIASELATEMCNTCQH